jgi:hypothetical protein
MHIYIHIYIHTYVQTQELLAAKQHVAECLHRRSEDASHIASLREEMASLQTSYESEARTSERLRSELAAATERTGAAVARAEDLAGKLRDEKRGREEVCCVCRVLVGTLCACGLEHSKELVSERMTGAFRKIC